MTKASQAAAKSTAVSIFGAILLAAGLAAAASPAAAGNLTFTFHSGPIAHGPRHGGHRPVLHHQPPPRVIHHRPPPRVIHQPRRHRGPDFASRPTRWQVSNHRERHSWYHNNVGRGHRLLPERARETRIGRGPGHRHGPVHRRGHGHGPNLVGGHGPSHQQPTHTGPSHGTGPIHAGSNSPGHRGCQSINGGTLLGAALGGLIGSQIGKGSGQLAATAAGTFIGGAVGSGAGCR